MNDLRPGRDGQVRSESSDEEGYDSDSDGQFSEGQDLDFPENPQIRALDENEIA